MRKVLWKTRPVPRCAAFPQGVTVEEYEVEVSDFEWRFLSAEAQQMRKHEPGSKAHTEHFNVIATTMELKILLGAKMLTGDEAEAAREAGATVLSQDAITETLATMRSLRDRGFKIPERAMHEVAAGQTSLLDSPPPEPPASPSDAPSPPDGPDVAGKRSEAPTPSAVGTPGVYGGRVPAFTLPEAIEMFKLWRADEFGWLKTRVLLLAYEHGEYHSEMLVGVPLTNRSLIGAVTNALAGADLMEALNKRGEVETRISSSTSRRRSNVWRLTFAGSQMAADMAEVEALVGWAFPERSTK